MNGTQTRESELTSTAEMYAQERAAIDASAQLPVLTFFGASVFWLMAGTVLALLASIKLHLPEFLDASGWLTFGRVRPAHLNTMTYGWASQAGIGVMLWLMARLSHVELSTPRLLLASAVLWNIGVTLGTVGILAGQGTSIEWLEFPPYAPPFLTAAFGLIGIWALVTFRLRRQQHVYVSQWYLFGAIFWFPWLYTAANLLMLYAPIQGVVQASVNWWYAHNILGLWLTPIGLAAAYYLIPKVLGRPVHSYYLSIVGFWALALFYNWAGAHHLIGGPLPAWLITLSIVGSVMMLIPVITVAINHHMTVWGASGEFPGEEVIKSGRGSGGSPGSPDRETSRIRGGPFSALRYSPTLRFVVFGAMCYTAVSVQGSLQSLRTINEITHFTHYTVAHAHLGVYGFFTMIMFGSFYYIVPRMTGWEWASSGLIRVHFWATALGIAFYFLALTWGGWYQGLDLNNPDVPFLQVVANTLPYLQARSWAGALMTVGHIAFTILFVMNVLRLGKQRRGPTLFAQNPLTPQPPLPRRGEEEKVSGGVRSLIPSRATGSASHQGANAG